MNSSLRIVDELTCLFLLAVGGQGALPRATQAARTLETGDGEYVEEGLVKVVAAGMYAAWLCGPRVARAGAERQDLAAVARLDADI